jgi:predicted nucleic acid-binding protein
LAKYYHQEIGTKVVKQLVRSRLNRVAISKLNTVEFFSASTKKIRVGQLSLPKYKTVTKQFIRDRTNNRFRIIRLTVAHYNHAEQLVRNYGPLQNLRTLDALQLAVALSLNTAKNPITFVCSDVALCSIAASEGLAVLNPETDPAA